MLLNRSSGSARAWLLLILGFVFLPLRFRMPIHSSYAVDFPGRRRRRRLTLSR